MGTVSTKSTVVMRHFLLRQASRASLALFAALSQIALVPSLARCADPIQRQPLRHASDLILQNGSLCVRYVTEQGQGVSKAVSNLRLRGKTIVITTTDADGKLTFVNLQSGLYELSVGTHREFIRAWEPPAAPDRALTTLVLIQDGWSVGASGPLAALELMSPGGSPVQFSQLPQEALQSCKSAEIHITPEP